MRIALLNVLFCPFCGNELGIREIYAGTPDAIVQGCLQCDCNIYPVCQGILILKHSPVKRYVLDFLKKRKFQQAALFAMANYVDDACRILNLLASFRTVGFLEKAALRMAAACFRRRYGRYFDDKIAFMDLLGDSAYDQYLKHRFSSETFWLIYPFLSPLRNRGGRFLEVGCGAGHAAFVVSRYASPSEMVCLDGNYRNLFLAQKYFTGADLIQLDANTPLPFPSGVFSCVVMMDSLHYVESRRLLIQEIERVLSSEGAMLNLHIHNAFADNVSPGYPFPPRSMNRLFERRIAIVPDQSIHEGFFHKERLDLTVPASQEAIDGSDAFCVTMNVAPANVEQAWDYLLSKRERLIINPLYDVRTQDDHRILTRRFPSKAYEMEYPFSAKWLPPLVEIDYDIERLIRESPDDTRIHELRKKFVVIDVPNHDGFS